MQQGKLRLAMSAGDELKQSAVAQRLLKRIRALADRQVSEKFNDADSHSALEFILHDEEAPLSVTTRAVGDLILAGAIDVNAPNPHHFKMELMAIMGTLMARAEHFESVRAEGRPEELSL
jgi:hypothetical protein